MFYSTNILTKKGPLGKIWLAAHFDKKLTKQQIFQTDIVNAVEQLITSPDPLSLRLSGHLMLGLVRIYSRKVRTLLLLVVFFLSLLFSFFLFYY
jgi:cohesin complex subunit SCC1